MFFSGINTFAEGQFKLQELVWRTMCKGKYHLIRELNILCATVVERFRYPVVI